MVRFVLAGVRVSPAAVARAAQGSAHSRSRPGTRGGGPRLRLGRSLLLPCTLGLLLCSALPVFAAPTVWVAPSYLRVKQDASPGSASEISVCAARGEWESFQVVVAGSATNVRITPPAGAAVTVKLFREHYLPVTHGSGTYSSQVNKPEGPGLYPDALIPFDAPGGAIPRAQPYSIPAGKVQPYWVDLFVPSDCAAGEHALPFTVTSDQGSATVTARLTVWAFELPQKPALQTAFAYWPPVRGQLQPELLLLENRIQPTFTEATHSAALAAAGQSAVHVGFWASLDESNCTIAKSKPTAAEVDAAIAKYAPLAPYAYLADEVYTSCDASTPLYNWTEKLRGKVRTMVTIAPRAGWEWLDIFVTLPKFDVAADVAAAQDRGSEVWSYNCLAQDDYSPKWLLDYAPINYRIQPGFLNWRRGLTGLLYWRVDYWSGGAGNPWTSGEVYSSASYPGEGLLVYPGANIGMASNTVVPSMRLKYLRDGVDDFDYLTLLTASGQGGWAQEVVAPIATDWRTWTRDSAALEAARRQLGERLNSPSASHTLSLTASASPATVASGGTASLSATATDSLGHAITEWSWSDGGAGGSFSPSPSVQNPGYLAPGNASDSVKQVTLSVTATCAGPTTISATAATALAVEPVAHTLSVSASASPTAIPSGGSASLSASAVDSRGHTITGWQWEDVGAGGSFAPSPNLPNCTYLAAENDTGADRVVTLTVTAACGGPTPIGGSETVHLTVHSISLELPVEAGTPVPSVVPSESTTDLSATTNDSERDGTASWLWDDNGADGAFLPSAAVRNPHYRAPRNSSGNDMTVMLTVMASCSDPAPMTGLDSTELVVESAPHAFTVSASADPSVVGWKGRTQLRATVEDTLGHGVAEWAWSDNGAGGSFSPSASVQNPSYRVTSGGSSVTTTIIISVHATCDGPDPLTASAYLGLIVEPKPKLRWGGGRRGEGEPTDSVLVIPSDPMDGATFSDLPADFWAGQAIEACVKAGIATGFPDGGYHPELTVTRDQVAVYLARAVAGGDELVPAGPEVPSFVDVPASHWAYRHVEYARAMEIVGGFPDASYRPAGEVTRAEMAAFIARSVVLPTGDEGLRSYQPPDRPTFADVPAEHWAYRYVEFIARQGIASGYQDGTYRPTNACNRAETAVYLARAFSLPL